MPRHARIDIPGLLQHVIVRGIERRPIVSDNEDRDNFIVRLERFLQDTNTDCYAWALLDNHFHLLVRPRSAKLSLFMRRLLTSYAVTFNKRHQRHGHLFQNRYKSIVCDDNRYLMELIRYIHLNPLRAGIIKELEDLDQHPWCGHRQLVNGDSRSIIQETLVLPLFSVNRKESRQLYRQFVRDGLEENTVRLSSGGKQVSLAIDAGLAEDDLFDERILGGGRFVETILQQIDTVPEANRPTIGDIVAIVTDYFELPQEQINRPGKAPLLTRAKAVICHITVRLLDYRGIEVGKTLCLTPGAVSHACRRGEQILYNDQELLNRLKKYL